MCFSIHCVCESMENGSLLGDRQNQFSIFQKLSYPMSRFRVLNLQKSRCKIKIQFTKHTYPRGPPFLDLFERRDHFIIEIIAHDRVLESWAPKI